MTKAEIFIKRHSSTILTVIGSMGVVATTVLAVKATPKALELIEEERQYRKKCATIFENDESHETVIVPDLTKLEIVKIAWKPYIPTAITGLSTIACILGANYLSTRTQASLMSAYALLDSSYREYRNRTRELYGDEAANIEHEIVKSKYDNSIILHEDTELFYDYQSGRYFESTMERVKRAELMLNQKLTTHGYACLNDFYDLLGIPRKPYGYDLGWSTMCSDKIYSYDSILLELVYEKAIMDDGLECNIITINFPPSLEYIR